MLGVWYANDSSKDVNGGPALHMRRILIVCLRGPDFGPRRDHNPTHKITTASRVGMSVEDEDRSKMTTL